MRYLNNLRTENGLESSTGLDKASIELVNQLLMTKKYQDPVHIAVLHTWLTTLDYSTSEAELKEKAYGESTFEAIKKAQFIDKTYKWTGK